ncbi:MAG TPA: S1 RNA-binding domain-containing protein, partial [Zeimonas sp.]|nr:S1 RNA-binding domain-containing protein [Zeimonas sp.]
FGVFVTLNDLYVEGLVHVSELGGEYFQYNETTHELRGERTGRRFRLTDELDVQVSRVDLEARRIDFRLVERMDFRAITRLRRREAPEDGGTRPADVVLPAAGEGASTEAARPARGKGAASRRAASKGAESRVRKAAKPKSDKVKRARAERLAARRGSGAPAAASAKRKRRR